MTNVTAKTSGLEQTLSLPQIVAMYIGAVVGSGVLLIPGLTAEIAGPASLVAWLAMSVLVVPMAITMGLLSAQYPNAGGVSHFVRVACGDRLGNAVGWFFLSSVPIGGPILAVTGARYVGVLLEWPNRYEYALAALILIAALVMNGLGLKLAGRVQTLVVGLIVAILLMAIAAAVPHTDIANFTPFAPHGWLSVVQAAGLMFWCFIGWEAVTHLSEEFVDPRRNAIRGVLWSAGLVALLYFAVSFMTVATHSYGGRLSEASLSVMVQLTFGPYGGWIVAVTALFICIATANAYVGAAARTAFALSQAGIAPRWFGRLHAKYRTPVGGLTFLACAFTVVLSVLASGWIDLSRLIELPNATFFATYIGGCWAGVRLLKGSRWGHGCAWISLVVTLAIYPFLGWSALYPLAIAGLVVYFERKKQRQPQS